MPSYAKISTLPSAETFSGEELFEVVQNGTSSKATALQIAQYLVQGGGGAAGVGASAMLSLFGVLTALSSGDGTLSGIPTGDLATPIYTAVWFSVAGVPQGWYLGPGTSTVNASGIQLPDDFDVSLNNVNWFQFA